jgi:diacylglycerol kinase family enzyme
VALVEIRTVDHSNCDGWLPLGTGYQWSRAVAIPETATAKTWARIVDPSEPAQSATVMAG